ncbi:addiction module antidote protein [Phenylobacterium sp.]|uniref:addiction module antidote protein n=1 Tax=Phenylobacterium sp. TaxID=1871053 RepID=UPI0025F8D051|nr:addiction module antidote protein [Phenylobacterium sp.]
MRSPEADTNALVTTTCGMTDLAEKTGLSRQALYKALSDDGNPRLNTFLKVMNALGLTLKVKTSEPA